MAELDAQPAARPDCDHHWIGHLKGGEPLSVRICSLCGDPDWDDLRRQLDELAPKYPTENPDVGKVAFRLEAWPHDPGANGQEYVSGHMPAAEAARWMREIADRCERYWADPECPWAGQDGHAPMSPRDEERERREEQAKLAALREDVDYDGYRPPPEGVTVDERCDCGHEPGEPCQAACQCGHAAERHMWFEPHPCGIGVSCSCPHFRAVSATTTTARADN